MLALPYDRIFRVVLNMALFRGCVYKRDTIHSLDNMEYNTNFTNSNVLFDEEVSK